MAVGACAHCPLRPFPAAVAQGTVLRPEPCDTSVDIGRFSHLAAVLPFVARVLQFLAVSRQGDVRYALSRFGKSRGRKGNDSRKTRCLSCDITVAVEPLEADAPCDMGYWNCRIHGVAVDGYQAFMQDSER